MKSKNADLVSVYLSSPLARPHFDRASPLVYVASRDDVRIVARTGSEEERDG